MGSSPLSRGILTPSRHRSCRLRIIPALAGNTKPPQQLNTGPQDHPRSRGEYEVSTTSTRSCGGSSPLSRGIRKSLEGCRVMIRIIPALAGNTPTPTLSAWTRAIIPALAGNTRHHGARRGWGCDHPRSRGEYGIVPGCSVQPGRSSPLSRGIPASTSTPRTPCGDHPRSRGEYQPSVSGQLGGNRSSPLSRGIRDLPGRGRLQPAIIPALAGNTQQRRTLRS